MAENNEKIRHAFVTFWLWVSTIGNIFGMLEDIKERTSYDQSYNFRIFLFVIVIAGNILVLNWKIIGFYFIVLALIVLPPVARYYYYTNLAFSIFISVIMFSVYFGILHIKKNGISTWEYLLNEAKDKKGETKVWFLGVSGLILLTLVLVIFPIKRYYHKTMLLFAPQRILHLSDYKGRVLGNHILETEYGTIKLGHFSEMFISDSGYIKVYIEAFRSGRAFHNLVFEGIEIPENIEVCITPTRISYIDPNSRDIMILSGIPINTGRILIKSSSDPDDILYRDPYFGHYYTEDIQFTGFRFADEHHTLADSTEINVKVSHLGIYKDRKHWVIENPPTMHHSLFVKLPGENEFIKYRTITFEENWGAFIEGELFYE
jgi:hypothetical protein